MRIADLLDAAVYVDFEGVAGESPSLIGIRANSQHSLLSLEQRFDRAVLAVGGRLARFYDALDELQSYALRRPVVGFTQHEANIFAEAGFGSLAQSYVNLHPVFRRAARRSGYLGPRTLRGFEQHFGYSRPHEPASFPVAATIRDLRGSLMGRRFEELSLETRTRCWGLYAHNFHDCASLEWILRQLDSETVLVR